MPPCWITLRVTHRAWTTLQVAHITDSHYDDKTKDFFFSLYIQNGINNIARDCASNCARNCAFSTGTIAGSLTRPENPIYLLIFLINLHAAAAANFAYFRA